MKADFLLKAPAKSLDKPSLFGVGVLYALNDLIQEYLFLPTISHNLFIQHNPRKSAAYHGQKLFQAPKLAITTTFVVGRFNAGKRLWPDTTAFSKGYAKFPLENLATYLVSVINLYDLMRQKSTSSLGFHPITTFSQTEHGKSVRRLVLASGCF